MSDIDLSGEILRKIDRRPGDQVTCRRVSLNHYRCNWWRSSKNSAGYDNPAMLELTCTTNRVYRSQFLHAVKSGEDLKITVLSSGGGEDLHAPEA